MVEEASIIAALNIAAPRKLYHPRGCQACGGQGFRGRVAVAEAFLTDAPFLRAIAQSLPMEALEDQVRSAGFVSMLGDGIGKAVAGITTLSEVMAAIHA